MNNTAITLRVEATLAPKIIVPACVLTSFRDDPRPTLTSMDFMRTLIADGPNGDPAWWALVAYGYRACTGRRPPGSWRTARLAKKRRKALAAWFLETYGASDEQPQTG